MGFIESSKSFIDLVLSVIAQKERRDERYDDALKSVTTAVNRTRSYLRRVESGLTANPENEEELAGLWTEASVKLRKIDNALAFDCNIKAYYWSDPNADFGTTVRRLDDIHGDCLRFLSPLRAELSQEEIVSLGL